MGEWTSIRIQTATNDNKFKTVWELKDRTIFADGAWFYGQVEVINRQVKIVTVRGEGESGWAAIDYIHVVNESPCRILPPQANPATTAAPQTTQPTQDPDHFPACKFEGGTCGWTSNKDEAEK